VSTDRVRLYLTPAIRDALVRLLRAALVMPHGSHIDDYIPQDPWTDVNEFRLSIYLPLHGEPVEPRSGRADLSIDVEQASPIRGVIDDLAESYSGGRPWPALTETDRRAVSRLVDSLLSA
jgi:hypothetical protein